MKAHSCSPPRVEHGHPGEWRLWGSQSSVWGVGRSRRVAWGRLGFGAWSCSPLRDSPVIEKVFVRCLAEALAFIILTIWK